MSASVIPARTARAIGSFPGGIHPAENKTQSLTRPIQSAPLPETLIIPLTQPGYQQAELLVKVGDHVLKGQPLARGRHGIGVVTHASSSGVVSAISEQAVPNASGLPELAVVISTDGRDQWLPHTGISDFQSVDRDVLLSRITEAGISGLGGAGFPTHIKLRNQHSLIKTLVINACECEPFITADDILMQERAPDIIQGIKILLYLLQPQQCLIGIEDNKPLARAALEKAIDDERIQVVSVPTKYPSGAEKQLIQLLTGLEIPSGTLPAKSGVLCQNVGTAYAIARAIDHGEALISRITTFTGAALNRPGNLEVLIGTPMEALLDACDLDRSQLSRLIMGGSLMGISMTALNLPLLKISNCVIATTAQEIPLPQAALACIRCGMCAEACPVSLLPQQLYWFARSKEHEKATRHNLFDCIECGACAYVCPSHIPLVQYYRAAKAEIRDEQDKHRRGEHSQQRFEFHQQRLEREKAKEEKRRQERAELARRNREAKAAGKPTAGQPDDIQATLERVRAKKAKAKELEENS
ncbi:MAG: electron transport complex subunit RsxC [Pseudomonadales bacterium]|nr:electron transport complex subunit RsxC [Pseudomonadales bacterium]